MCGLLESDTAFYVAVSAFVTALFVAGLAVFAVTDPDSL